MIYGLVEALFGIIKLIWNAPFWLVVLVIVICGIYNFVGHLFFFFDDYGSTINTGYGADSGHVYTDTYHKVDHTFVFYDYNGDRRGRGDCFYDSKGCRRSWGDGFYDGEGYYRNWGDSYYDARGHFRSWGGCFYDTQGNLVYPNQ